MMLHGATDTTYKRCRGCKSIIYSLNKKQKMSVFKQHEIETYDLNYQVNKKLLITLDNSSLPDAETNRTVHTILRALLNVFCPSYFSISG